MTSPSSRWASSLTRILAVLTLGALGLLGLAVVAIANGLGDDELGASIAVAGAVFLALVLAVSAPLWWLAAQGRRRATSGRADRLSLAAGLSLAVGIGTLLFPTLLADAVGSTLLLALPFLVVGFALVVTSGGLLRSLNRA